MAIISPSQVRAVTGIPEDLISDTTFLEIINEVEAKTLSFFNFYSTPTKVIEILDGNNKSTLKINKPYIWKVLELKFKNDAIDLEYVTFNHLSGIIDLGATQSPYLFTPYANSVKIKYLSGFMEKTNTITETTSDVVAGTSVDIAIEDDLFVVNDWVLIEGTDGKREIAKVTAIDTNEITVNNLVQTHESGSVVTKIQTHQLLKQFILYESAMTAAINAIGGTYTFNTSYSIEGVTTTLGVPYPHFEKSTNANQKQRDIVKAQIYNKLNSIY